MRKSILIGGQAGQGINKSAWLIGRALTNLGFYVFIYRDYQSLIRGGHNFNIIEVSDEPVYSQTEKFDIVLALDQKTREKYQKKLNSKGFVLALPGVSFETRKENNVLLGCLFKSIGLPLEALKKTLKKEFGPKKEITKSLEQGFSKEKRRQTWPRPQSPSKRLISGSEAVAQGALKSGLELYFAYPMTPATPVMHCLAEVQEKENILVLQLENEIAVANAALGAAFGGARAMVGTSGGGFALMSETISLAGASGLPLVAYLASRSAPASGVPTYQTQGDLKFALNVGHGEFPKVVALPGDPREALKKTNEVFYLSYKYGLPGIILSDKHLAESWFSFDDADMSSLKTASVPSLSIEKDSFPNRVTSYEHNRQGLGVDKAQGVKKSVERRLNKVSKIEQEVEKLESVKIFGQGKNLLIGWGSTKGAILDALKELSDWRFLQICYASPFPKKQVAEEIEKSDKVVLVENNATGLMGQVIAEKTGLKISNKILKYDGRPFTKKLLINLITNYSN